MTTLARGSRHELNYIEESVLGTSPASITTDMKEWRHTSCGLQLTKGSFQSNELRSDRQIADFRHGQKQIGGDIGIELEYGPHDDWIEGALFGDWTSATWSTDNGFSLNATGPYLLSANNSFTGSSLGIAVGDWVEVTGFTGGTDQTNLPYMVTAASAASLTLDGTLTSSAASGYSTVLWKYAKCANGTTQHSYSVERGYEGLDTNQYHLFTGCMANTFALTMPADGMITGTFSVTGMGISTAATAQDSAPTAAATTKPMSMYQGTIYSAGTSSSVMSSLSLNLTNNINPAFAIGSDSAISLIDGRCNVTGSISAYFQDSTEYNKFMNETETSLKAIVEDIPAGTSRGNRYVIHIPRVVYTSGDVPTNDEGAIMITFNFQALYEADYGYTLAISKIPSD